MGTPTGPIPTSTLGAPCWARPNSRSRTTSRPDRLNTASLTMAAPVARIAWQRSSRSAGVSSKSCVDSTMLRPLRSAISGPKSPLHSRSTHSAPSASARVSMRRRSSSEPTKPPPSQVGRQVTTTGVRRSASAPSTSRSRTESSRSSTRSASTAASRRARSSAVVSAVTVAHN